MRWRNTERRYGVIAQLLHWTIALLILTQFILASVFEDMPLGLEKIAWIVRHKALGMSILTLACLRLLWRMFNPAPQLPRDMQPYARRLAHFSHIGLYILIFTIPLSGWIMSSLAGIPVSYFGWFNIPVMLPADKTLVEASKTVHWYLNILLVVTVCLHVTGALYHHFYKKDDVLRRMLPLSLFKDKGL